MLLAGWLAAWLSSWLICRCWVLVIAPTRRRWRRLRGRQSAGVAPTAEPKALIGWVGLLWVSLLVVWKRLVCQLIAWSVGTVDGGYLTAVVWNVATLVDCYFAGWLVGRWLMSGAWLAASLMVTVYRLRRLGWTAVLLWDG